MNESLQGKEVIVVEGYCDLSQAGEKVRLCLTSRQKLPAFWDLQEVELFGFLLSQ